MNDLEGVFDAIDTEQSAHDPVAEPVSEPQGEGAPAPTETETSETETNTKTNTTGEVEQGQAPTSEQGQPAPETTTTETSEPSKTETETQVDVDNWEESLPPRPQGYDGPAPEVDPETGQITNMTAAEYATYMRESTKAELRSELYDQMIETRSLEVAEKVLPEMKTNPAIASLVRNARMAAALDGNQLTSVEAAKQVRDALGLAPERLAQAKAEGVQSAKTSIEVQKNASLETSSSQTQTDTSKADNLVKRINRGDDEAFLELLNDWTEEGKI